jgi:RNA polymerase sigma-70 factor (ECF subfamily)
MDIKKHPKRIKDKYNPYTLEINDNKYTLSFVDGEGNNQKMEIDENLYLLFNSFELEDLSHIVEVSRHYEHSVLTDNALNQRAFIQLQDIETIAMRDMQVQAIAIAMKSLSEIQSRRIALYYIFGYTYLEIAKMDHCTTSSVAKSIERGIKKIRAIVNDETH